MNLSKQIKKPFTIVAVTITLAIVFILMALTYMISFQNQDAMMINTSGRQRMLSQRITKQVFYNLIDDNNEIQRYSKNDLNQSVQEWKDAQLFLVNGNNINGGLERVDSLLNITGEQILEVERLVSLIANKDIRLEDAAGKISIIETNFLAHMEQITSWLQQESERKNKLAINICFVLTIIALSIILIEFFIFVLPAARHLSKKNTDLTQANKQLTDFAQITAHNLRAPIGNLIFLSNFYKEADSDQEKNELFEKINTVIQHLDETIHVLLDGLQIKTRDDIVMEELSFQKTLDQTKDLLSGEILKTKAIITSDFTAASSITYNKIYLESIILNLVGNAIKYSDPNRIPEIKVYTKMSKGRTQLFVSDNGLGINLERQGKKVFGLHQTFHRHQNSKGIGLFMTKNHVQSLGGTIEVESVPNKGSTFAVSF